MTLRYPVIILRHGLRRLVRNLPTQLMTTACLAVALALAGSAYGFYLQLEQLTSRLNQELRLIAFLKPGPEPGHRLIAQEIATWPDIQGVITVSRAEARERVKELLGPAAGLLEGVEDDVLPSLLEIQLTAGGFTAQRLAQLKARLEGLDQIDEAAYARETAKNLRNLADRLRTLGRGLALALLAATGFIIFTTTRLSYQAHREEVSILRLVGATGWFIRGPFLVQGGLLGLVAAGLAILLAFLLQTWLGLGPEVRLGGVPVRLIMVDSRVVGAILGGGLVAGLGGAWLGLGRIMRAK